jgi:outer membrane protein assembly factor BamE (lipoprotein component of BamABCDE complex)
MKKLTVTLSLIFLTSCIIQNEKRGYSFELSDYQLTKEGVSNQEMIIKMMGSPTFVSEGSDNKELWVYFSEDVRKLLFFKPKILDRKIMTISFDDSGTASKINNYSLNDENNVKFASEFTEVQSNKKSFWSQIFGNIGQVRAN